MEEVQDGVVSIPKQDVHPQDRQLEAHPEPKHHSEPELLVQGKAHMKPSTI